MLLAIYRDELKCLQMTCLNGCLGSLQCLGLEMARGTEVVYDPKLLPGKMDNGSYLQSEPHPLNMLYGRTYSRSGNQSDCRGDGTPNILYYEVSQHLQN